MMNKELLKYYIARAGLTQSKAAQRLDMSRQAFSQKMRGVVPFKLGELCVLVYMLGLTADEVMDVFFAKVVDTQNTRGLKSGTTEDA